MSEKKIIYVPLNQINKIDFSLIDLSVELPLSDETKKEMDFMSDEIYNFSYKCDFALNEKLNYIKDKRQYKKDVNNILNTINYCFIDDINDIIISYLPYNNIDYEKRYNRFYDIYLKSQNLFLRFETYYFGFLNNKFKYEKEFNDYIKRCKNVKEYKWQYLELSYNYKKYESFKKNLFYIETYTSQYKFFTRDLLKYINEPLEDLKNGIYISNKI